MKTKFNLGDIVYLGQYERKNYVIDCPDCGGTKKIKVTLHSGESWNIDCGGCDQGGWAGPSGVITQFEMLVTVTKCVVDEIRMVSDGTVQYLCKSDDLPGSTRWSPTEENVFGTPEEALAGAEALRERIQAENNQVMLRKTRDEKSWAWALTYHRKQIKRLTDEIAHHNQRVQLCAEHVKNKD